MLPLSKRKRFFVELTDVSQHDRIVVVLMLTGFALVAGVCLWLYWRERQAFRAYRRALFALEKKSHEKEKSDAAR